MPRIKKLSLEQTKAIPESPEKGVYFSQLYGVSRVTISRIRNNHIYADPDPLELGSPVLDSHGRVVNVVPSVDDIADTTPEVETRAFSD